MTACKCCDYRCRRFGRNASAIQRYRCLRCRKTFSEPRRCVGNMCLLFEPWCRATELLAEGNFIRSPHFLTDGVATRDSRTGLWRGRDLAAGFVWDGCGQWTELRNVTYSLTVVFFRAATTVLPSASCEGRPRTHRELRRLGGQRDERPAMPTQAGGSPARYVIGARDLDEWSHDYRG